LFDIPGQIRKAINDFLLWVAKTGLQPVLDTLGQTVLSTPDLTGNAQVKAFWTTSLIAANGIFVLFVIAGGFIVASRETLQTRYGLKEIAPRVVVAAVAANVSLLVCGKAIEAVNALTAAIAGQGVDGQGAATAIEQILNQPVAGTTPPILFALLILAALAMAIVVVMTFVLRIAFLVVLVGVAPLALTGHATPLTEGLAYAWWRAFARLPGHPARPGRHHPRHHPGVPHPGRAAGARHASHHGRAAVHPGVPDHAVAADQAARLDEVHDPRPARPPERTRPGRADHPRGRLAEDPRRARWGRRPDEPSRPSPTGGPSSSGGPSPGRPTAGTPGRRPRPRVGSVPARPAPSGNRPTGLSDPPPAPAPRPGPAPGPATFSHAPAHHVPMSPPAGNATAPVFSDASPSAARPTRATPAQAVRFLPPATTCGGHARNRLPAGPPRSSAAPLPRTHRGAAPLRHRR
jgi:hypothetical protein